MTSSQDESQEILQLTQSLLDAIANADWRTYESLCDPTITALEPEAKGQLIEGLEYHRFYFRLGAAREGHNTTICSPRIRIASDMAVIAYVRLNQRLDENAQPSESAVEETRVWQRIDGQWKHVHFHRSPPHR